jgi:hypothetical protein
MTFMGFCNKPLSSVSWILSALLTYFIKNFNSISNLCLDLQNGFFQTFEWIVFNFLSPPICAVHPISFISKYLSKITCLNLLSISLLVKHCHRDMWGNGSIAPPFLFSVLDGGDYQLHAIAALTPRKEPPLHCDVWKCLNVEYLWQYVNLKLFRQVAIFRIRFI